ncbi:MAG TPA: hypothetical protein VNG29_00140 [Candidatus Paceibacterota bacterium]|nr:hypothetical protein [Candidatus Paceibacterota bacterium]
MKKERSDIDLTEMHERRKRRKRFTVVLLAALGIYVLLLATALIVLKSPVFRVQSVSVVGNAAIASGSILDVVRSDALQGPWRPVKAMLGFQNMLIWPHALKTSSLALIPGVARVTLAKDYSARSIVVNVTERSPYGIWCFAPAPPGGQNATSTGLPGSAPCWWFDDGGILFAHAAGASNNVFTTVYDYSQPGGSLRSAMLPAEFIPNAFSIFRVLRSSGLVIDEIALRDLALEELEADVHNGPKLYFSLRFPADDDLAAIQSLAAKTGFSKIGYIDLTVRDRVYYK